MGAEYMGSACACAFLHLLLKTLFSFLSQSNRVRFTLELCTLIQSPPSMQLPLSREDVCLHIPWPATWCKSIAEFLLSPFVSLLLPPFCLIIQLLLIVWFFF